MQMVQFETFHIRDALVHRSYSSQGSQAAVRKGHL